MVEADFIALSHITFSVSTTGSLLNICATFSKRGEKLGKVVDLGSGLSNFAHVSRLNSAQITIKELLHH